MKFARIAGGSILVLGALVVACRGSSSDAPPKAATPDAPPTVVAPGRVAARHRAAAPACPTRTPPPGYVSKPPTKLDDAFACNSDADCKGTNARCHHGSRYGTYCSFDACTRDAECKAGTLCECGPDANVCLSATCRIDADCGAYSCSPTAADTCGNMSGIVGYYCHGAKDECVDDADCKLPTGVTGLCTYKPTVAHWTCSFEECVG